MLIVRGESVAAVDESDDHFGSVAMLRARAERYRSLAENLSNPEIVAVAQECARELEREAEVREQIQTLGVTRAA